MSEIPVTNWAGTVVFEAAQRHAPTAVDEVQRLVRDAGSAGWRLRALGTGHCFNGIADTDGVHVSLRSLPRRVELDEGAASVTIDGGATYAEVNAALAQRGWALANLASLPHISVAGAIATATHGSGWGNQGLASAVRSLSTSDPDGPFFPEGFSPLHTWFRETFFFSALIAAFKYWPQASHWAFLWVRDCNVFPFMKHQVSSH